MRLVDGTNRPIDIKTHPFFSRPAADMSSRQMFEAIMVDVLTEGNAFAVPIAVDARGAITRVATVSPQHVADATRNDSPVPSYRVSGVDGVLGPLDILHFRGLRRGGHTWGLSPVVVLGQILSVHGSEIAAVANSYDGGARPNGYLTTDQRIGAEVLKEAAVEFAETSAGRGAGVPALSHGLSWQTITASNDDLELLESRRWTAQEAAMACGIPPHLIGAPTASSGTYSSVQQDLRMWSRLALDRWRHMIADEFAFHGIDAHLEAVDLLEPTILERAQADAADIKSGVLTVAEARAGRGLEPLPEPDPDPDPDPEPEPEPEPEPDPEEPDADFAQ